jgi:integrase
MPRRRAPAGAGAVIDRWKGSKGSRPGSRWEGRYSVVVAGRRVQRSVYAPTQKEAQAKLAAALAEARSARPPEGASLTVEEWLRAWLAVQEGRLRFQTYKRYENITRLHLIPGLGTRRLAALNVADVESFLRSQPDLSPRTVGHFRAVLRTALNDAIRHGHVTTNVAQLARPPRTPAKERRTWTVEERDRVLSALEGSDMLAPAATALYAGLRQGELLGLRWSDVAGGMLRVRHSVIRQGGRSVLVEPKSATSQRNVPISERLGAILADHRRSQEAHRVALGIEPLASDDPVFTNEFGELMEPSSMTRRFQRLLLAAGVPPCGFHELRHAFGSILVNAGAELVTVSRLLGHSGIGITADTYTRDPRDRMAAAIKLL